MHTITDNASNLNVVVLAGGMGTRLAEETEIRPKPLVEVGARPILWHILRHYSHFGYKQFFIALGYKGDVIKRYFLDYHDLNGSMTVGLANGEVRRHQHDGDDWIVNLIETGHETNTGGRVRRLRPWLENGTFMVTYGDGVADVDLGALTRFHRQHGRIATLTAVRPPARYGGLIFDGDRIANFTEKPHSGEGWINGGYLVFEPAIFDYLESDGTSLEYHGLERLAADGQLMAYRHEGFWQCMDTLRDKRYLDGLWQSGKAPWKIWQ
jgi:glucose-1-phosphate cytidylyltransferase